MREELRSIEQVAAQADRSMASVLNAVRSAILPSVYVKNRRRITQAAADAWIAGGCKTTRLETHRLASATTKKASAAR